MNRLPPVDVLNRAGIAEAVVVHRRIITDQRLPLALSDLMLRQVEVMG